MKTNLRRNVISILVDVCGFGTSLGFIGSDTLLPILAFTLTRDKALVGLIGTLWIGMWLLPPLVAGRWMARRARKQPVMLTSALISRVALTVLVVLLALGRGLDPFFMFICVAVGVSIFRGFDAVAAVAWLDILTKALPMRVRSQVFGMGQAVSNVLRFGAALIVAAAISGGLQYPDSFVMLYGFAALALAIGWVGLAAIREPVGDHAAAPSIPMG